MNTSESLKAVKAKIFLLLIKEEFLKRKLSEEKGIQQEIKKSKYNPLSNSPVVQKIWQQFEEEYQKERKTKL